VRVVSFGLDHPRFYFSIHRNRNRNQPYTSVGENAIDVKNDDFDFACAILCNYVHISILPIGFGCGFGSPGPSRENGEMSEDLPHRREKELPALEPEDYYFEGPNIVFTAAYHLKRGYCCESGCRHCPYKSVDSDQSAS
jgi:hypothetical protein